ncbi:hypothetical protein BDW22DRAFT_1456337 [Trametopsis cervina]|nr:hypothetical protein BDW22DRAFT_1456337 [Trametopsis cervina]
MRLRYARTAFLHCAEFPWMIRKWRNGRDRVQNKGICSQAARKEMDQWCVENVNLLINKEMRNLAPVFLSPIKEVTEETLLAIDLKEISRSCQAKAPTLWTVLHNASTTPLQLKRAKYKDHTAPITMMVSICSYGRSHFRNKLQQANGIYLKASGLSAKGLDTTNAYGLTMSQRWIYNLVESLSDASHKARNTDIQKYPTAAGCDNINLGFKVFEQRGSHQSHFDSGTAGTIYVFKAPGIVAPDRLAYEAHRALHGQTLLTTREILVLDYQAGPRIRAQAVYRVLKFLFQAPAFDIDSYEQKNHASLRRPPPVQQLPTGKAHALCQYMLDTIHVESASQEGTRKCLDNFLAQCNLSGPQIKEEPAQRRLLVWMGDQLTVVRIRSIKKDRSEDFNFVQRFDRILEVFGWFHCQLAEDTSFHKQYYKTATIFGLEHAFNVLGRKGLTSPSVQGLFHHTMQEALWHIAEARFRDLWLVVGNVSDLAELRQRTPQQLRALAEKIVDDRASTGALADLKLIPRKEQDDVFMQSVLFCRDILCYLDFDNAMKTGDVGRMRDLIPRLFFRFHGGKNHNYARELLELLQGILHEWPDDLSSFVMQHCWLANTTGLPGKFLAFDMVQEHNIRDIKHIFAVHGPFATWDYIQKISASIPTQRKLKDHFEDHINHFRRGKSHTTPAWEQDVASLQVSYHKGNAHVWRAGRTLAKRAPDFQALGSDSASIKQAIHRWAAKRVTVRSTDEEFEEGE